MNNLVTSEAAEERFSLTLQQARALHLAAQGLLTKPKMKASKTDVLATIEQMCLLQIDTIHVVARSPYLVLFSRLGNYPMQWLGDLLTEGSIFEGWAHEACFVSMKDYWLHHFNRHNRVSHWAYRHAQRMYSEHSGSMNQLLGHIRQHGPVKASDFERNKSSTSSAWWGWKDEKRWLEAWFALGELMIARRENFHRVYDLTERVLGEKFSRRSSELSSYLNLHELERTLVLKAVRALGITQAQWIADYFRTSKKLKDSDLEVLVEEGQIFRVVVKGWKAFGYIHRDHLPLARKAMANQLRATYTTLLSPFDPVVWDRQRAKVFFNFDYTLECYTPAPKRRYGYFVLPILHRGQLVGRLDAKAHRMEKAFEIKNIFFEQSVRITPSLLQSVVQAIQRCADWHETPKVIVGKLEPSDWSWQLRERISAIKTKKPSKI